MSVDLIIQDFISSNSTYIDDLPKDDILERLPLMSSPWPTATIVSAYLFFVLKAGPKLMEKRTPYRLRHILMAYNLFLVLSSSWYILKVYSLTAGKFFRCHCIPSTLSPETHDQLKVMTWIYFISKLVELMDTVFFILRRKMNQVTFLHVYHHANLAMLTWFFIKYVEDSQLLIIAQCNTLVHAFMYSYYFLSALGPSVQKYLWWKRYLTRLQMFQFVVIMGFMLILIATPECKVPTGMLILSVCNTASFLVLFIFFYAKAYRTKHKSA